MWTSYESTNSMYCWARKQPSIRSAVQVDVYLAVLVVPLVVFEQLVCWQGLEGACVPRWARGRPTHLYQHHAHHGFHFQVLPNHLLMLEREEQADLQVRCSNSQAQVRYLQYPSQQTIEQECKIKFSSSMAEHRRTSNKAIFEMSM